MILCDCGRQAIVLHPKLDGLGGEFLCDECVQVRDALRRLTKSPARCTVQFSTGGFCSKHRGHEGLHAL